MVTVTGLEVDATLATVFDFPSYANTDTHVLYVVWSSVIVHKHDKRGHDGSVHNQMQYSEADEHTQYVC